MFVELAEFLQCPEKHEQTFLVVMPLRMSDRAIVEGTIGCPVCKREFRIEEGIARFDEATAGVDARESVDTTPVQADALQALIHLSGPGGLVIMVGSAARLAWGLAELVDGVHIAACNPPKDVESSERISIFRSGAGIPFRPSVARAVVVGAEYVEGSWPTEAARVLLRGLRLVLFASVPPPPGITQLATVPGVVVGEKA